MPTQKVKRVIRLYHFTSYNEANAILEDGFRDGESDSCWLTPDPRTVSGEKSGHSLLEVALDIQEQELEVYRRDVNEVEIDPVTDEEIPGGDALVCHWYEVPAAVINAHAIGVRLVPLDERETLML